MNRQSASSTSNSGGGGGERSSKLASIRRRATHHSSNKHRGGGGTAAHGGDTLHPSDRSRRDDAASATTTTTTTTPRAPPSAAPTLKVMRLQSPSLSSASAGCIGGGFPLSPALRLPDSFGSIHVGETFRAYLGALNASRDADVVGLRVRASLQTPSGRYPLPSPLDDPDDPADAVLAPGDHASAVVSRGLEEVGPHVLRVDVDHGRDGRGRADYRKYYRFQVSSPLSIAEEAVSRWSRSSKGRDGGCAVLVTAENATRASTLAIADVDLAPAEGLVAEPSTPRADASSSASSASSSSSRRTAVALFDDAGRLGPGAATRRLFLVRPVDGSRRRIARGDELGRVVVSWRKTMGEAGRVVSSVPVLCPAAAAGGDDDPVAHGAGLADDAAAVAARPPSRRDPRTTTPVVTVEPIDPPSVLATARPVAVRLSVVNHSTRRSRLQLQMTSPGDDDHDDVAGAGAGVVVCGPSFRDLGVVPPSGGRVVVSVRLVALSVGLWRCGRCRVVDLDTGLEIAVPDLFHVLVTEEPPSDESATTK